MIKTFLMAAMAVCVMAVSGCLQTEQAQTIIAKTCSVGQTTYAFIITAHSTGNLSDRNKGLADGIYAQVDVVCKKGNAVTEADVVLAGLKVADLVKIWRTAT